jgi:hypothetical protein
MEISKFKDIAKEAFVNIDQYRNHNHVSLIVKGSKILGLGINRRKTHPLAKKYGYRNYELHSELDALLKVPKQMRKNLILINFRFGPMGDMKLSKPCPKCLPWCMETFKEIYYSIPNGLVQLEY